VPERTAAPGQKSTSRVWAGTEPSRANDINGWQIVVADSLEPAHLGLQREHNIASEVGTGAHGPAIFIWRSQQALIVARGQTHWPGFEAAAAALAQMGWPVLIRRSGGGAFPIGPGTVQIAMMARYPEFGMSMEGIYNRLGALIGSSLAEFGIAARVGDTPGAFCDGRHDLVVAGRKIAGLAQHWRLCGCSERCVTAAASVLVDEQLGALTEIVDRFHAMCGQRIDIRPEAMTTVRDNCHAVVLSHRNLAAEFLANLAAGHLAFGHDDQHQQEWATPLT
jgi:octanoyl-[GcvH]:protein N-octanoyltransferase